MVNLKRSQSQRLTSEAIRAESLWSGAGSNVVMYAESEWLTTLSSDVRSDSFIREWPSPARKML